MSSLIVSHDPRIVMLEVVVRNLHVPWTDVFDQAVMKKTILKFRMLDEEWTSLLPNRSDYRSYRGSNYQNENFHGGCSVVFAVPEETLHGKVDGVYVQFYVHKEVSRYFEADSRRYFGRTQVRVDDPLNGIIKDLRERKQLEDHMSSGLAREPVSRSSCGVYPLLDSEERCTGGTIEVYLRISYLGECIVTEIDPGTMRKKAFRGREATDTRSRYQFRELTRAELDAGAWGSATLVSPTHPRRTLCQCQEPGALGLADKEEGTEDADLAAARRGRRKSGVGRGRGGRKRGQSFAEEMARMKNLLAMLKEARRGKGAVSVGLAEKPRKVCRAPTTTTEAPCTLGCRSTCGYLPSCFPVPCQGTILCCQQVTCALVPFR